MLVFPNCTLSLEGEKSFFFFFKVFVSLNKLLIKGDDPLLLLVSCEVGNVVSEGLQVLPLVLQSSVNQLQSLLQLSRAKCIDIRVSIHALQL